MEKYLNNFKNIKMDSDNDNEVNKEETSEDKIKSFHEFGLDDRILKV